MSKDKPEVRLAESERWDRSKTHRRLCLLVALLGMWLSACVPLPTVPLEERLRLSQTTLTLSFLGETVQVDASVVDEFGIELRNAAVAWASSAPAVASVSSTGAVTALANGPATVTGSRGGASVSVLVTVAQAPAMMLLSTRELVLGGPGDTGSIALSVLDAGGSVLAVPHVAWWADDPGVASVSPSGLVTAVAPGRTEVTVAVSGGGQTLAESIQITVEGEIINDVDVTDAILVDATHDGGAWWYPQSGTFDRREPHQGQALADHLRRLGYTIIELGRDDEITDELLDRYHMVVRAGVFGTYTPSELSAYERYLSRSDARLVLVTNFLTSGQLDPLAHAIGLPMQGSYHGMMMPIGTSVVTEGVGPLDFGPGAAVGMGAKASITPLGALEDGSVVMGLVTSEAARVLFLGQLLTLERVPEPLVSNLIRWLTDTL